MIYRFANCRLDTHTLELVRNGSLVRVQPQVFDLLRVLVENRDRVLDKEALFESVWGGRIVSEVTLSSRINAARRAVGDNGTSQDVIRTVPRRGYRFIAPVLVDGNPIKPCVAPTDGPTLPLAVKPGAEHGTARRNGPIIAVLPFFNLSGDPRQEYFVEGVVEEIVTSLSQLRWLTVISRASALIYKGRAVEARTVGAAVGADYVLTGSVRRSGRRVRLNAQLADARSGENVWANRFDFDFNDLFRAQDELANAVIGSIETGLRRAEIERAARTPIRNMAAYDYYLRSLPGQYRPTPERLAQGLRMLDEALAIDPNYPPANALAAWMHFYRVGATWSSSPKDDGVKAVRLASAAVEEGEDHAGALSQAAFVLASVGKNVEFGVSTATRAAEFAPNSATSLHHFGWILTLAGDQENALARLQDSLRLSPSNPDAYRIYTGCAAASVLAGRFESAVAFAQQALQRNARFGVTYRFLAAAHAQLGEGDEARRAMNCLRAFEPTVTISHLRHLLPYRDEAQGRRLWDGLREAGMKV